jgi:hypothetical protein
VSHSIDAPSVLFGAAFQAFHANSADVLLASVLSNPGWRGVIVPPETGALPVV